MAKISEEDDEQLSPAGGQVPLEDARSAETQSSDTMVPVSSPEIVPSIGHERNEQNPEGIMGNASGSGLAPAQVPGDTQLHARLTVENVGMVNSQYNTQGSSSSEPLQSFSVQESHMNARLAWGQGPIKPVKQLGTQRSSQPDLVNEDAIVRLLPQESPQAIMEDSPTSRGGYSVDSRETFGASGLEEYRRNVYELSQNPWGPDVVNHTVQNPHGRIVNATQPSPAGQTPAVVHKQYRAALGSTSERVARFGWGIVKNFWTWMTVIAVLAAREGFREELRGKQDIKIEEEYDYWEPSESSSGAETDEEHSDLANLMGGRLNGAAYLG